jgi:serine-type D-Ala-D-Ala carboxypeptidase (penicillin-binding protein 5/6)
MRGRPACFVATACLWLAALALVAPVAGAAPSQPAPPPPLPKAYVLVDADTGAVITQLDDRTLRPPASTIKLLTALIASQRLKPGDAVPISSVAEGMPARKINVKANQVWAYDHLMYSMMMVSANDAAVALAEKIGGGSLDGYVPIADATAARLGLADHPILFDPAGLDDQFSNKGGDRISPRDLAIVARAVLASPGLMQVVGTRDYKFNGGDGLPHKLTNHNLFLDLYAGANGLKTGTTDLAGHTFVGSATRNGRTMLVVVFDAVDYYASAGALLDQGFNTSVNAEVGLDRLPPVIGDASLPPPTTSPAPVATVVQHAGSTSIFDSTAFALVVLLVGLLPLRALRRRVVERSVPPPDDDFHDHSRDRRRELVGSSR